MIIDQYGRELEPAHAPSLAHLSEPKIEVHQEVIIVYYAVKAHR
jgi:hypothetical protein